MPFPWEEFIFYPNSSNCREFSTVTHTTHVDHALNILNRGEVMPGLVFDKSILNDQRILVGWSSPNHWHHGFRYGNIQFGFDFAQLINGMNIYWVESIAYNTPAARILVTDKNRDSDPLLIRYDPINDHGPWRYDLTGNTHYFNSNYCLEFMFEGSMPLGTVSHLTFVDHHRDFCSVHRNSPKSCIHLGARSWQGGAALIGALAGQGRTFGAYSHLLLNQGQADWDLKNAFEEIYRRASRSVQFHGGTLRDAKKAPVLARAICTFIAYGNFDDAKDMASEFLNEEELEHALANEVAKVVNLADPISLLISQ